MNPSLSLCLSSFRSLCTLSRCLAASTALSLCLSVARARVLSFSSPPPFRPPLSLLARPGAFHPGMARWPHVCSACFYYCRAPGRVFLAVLASVKLHIYLSLPVCLCLCLSLCPTLAPAPLLHAQPTKRSFSHLPSSTSPVAYDILPSPSFLPFSLAFHQLLGGGTNQGYNFMQPAYKNQNTLKKTKKTKGKHIYIYISRY